MKFKISAFPDVEISLVTFLTRQDIILSIKLTIFICVIVSNEFDYLFCNSSSTLVECLSEWIALPVVMMLL